MLEEYIVTLKNFEDLDQFYDDMETPGGSLYIPDREVDVALRRPISRNTHYMLTAEESELIKQDSRVLDIVSRSELDSIQIKPLYTQTSSGWNKSNSLSNTHRNWGLLRCVEGTQRSNWGSDGTTSQTGTIDVTSSGKNVDVIIVDGHLDPSHPEFAVNNDGTGGSRVIQYNWFLHNPQVTGGGAGTYTYTPYIDAGNADRTGDNNHGIHVAGTVAGNTHGWARDANIYNINPYATNVNGLLSDTLLFDYIREFHRTKAVNPITGYKNPTIVNNSWGSAYAPLKTAVTNVFWRGTNYTSGFTNNTNLENWGLVNYDASNIFIPVWLSSLLVDVEDTMSDGIILVGAAGNESFKIDASGGTDYNNAITWSGNTRNYHRGSWNTVAGNAICVGSVSILKNESKADYSNCGSRIDVYAPGTMIISAIHTEAVTVADPRNSSYRLTKYQGTSMASPQVCGVIACLLEQYPRMKQSDVKTYLDAHCTLNQMTNTGKDTRSWTLTASGSSGYTFAGFSTGTNIAITCPEGTILNFTNNTGSAHPLWIKTTQTTGNIGGVTTGTIANNGGINGAVVSWDTFGVTPGLYYYICQNHSAMFGTITITSAYTNNTSLQGSTNRYLFYKKERTTSGSVYPRLSYSNRPSTGQVWPRRRVFRST